MTDAGKKKQTTNASQRDKHRQSSTKAITLPREKASWVDAAA
jgi:hypothetical protein